MTSSHLSTANKALELTEFLITQVSNEFIFLFQTCNNIFLHKRFYMKSHIFTTYGKAGMDTGQGPGVRTRLFYGGTSKLHMEEKCTDNALRSNLLSSLHTSDLPLSEII